MGGGEPFTNQIDISTVCDTDKVKDEGEKIWGGARLPNHRLAWSTTYNPHRVNHCGYQCLLRCAGYRATMKQVRCLRHAVAYETVRAYEENMCLYGINIRDIVDQSGHSIEKYARHVMEQQWASQAEMAIGAALLRVNVSLQGRGMYMRLEYDSLLGSHVQTCDGNKAGPSFIHGKLSAQHFHK